jgi:hypothetical protein
MPSPTGGGFYKDSCPTELFLLENTGSTFSVTHTLPPHTNIYLCMTQIFYLRVSHIHYRHKQIFYLCMTQIFYLRVSHIHYRHKQIFYLCMTQIFHPRMTHTLTTSAHKKYCTSTGCKYSTSSYHKQYTPHDTISGPVPLRQPVVSFNLPLTHSDPEISGAVEQTSIKPRSSGCTIILFVHHLSRPPLQST